jgi:cofilin
MGKKIKYVIFGLSKDNIEIVVLKTSDSSSYDDFIADLPEADCRWAVYDLEFETKEGGKRNKICFFSWYVDCFILLNFQLRNFRQGLPMMPR